MIDQSRAGRPSCCAGTVDALGNVTYTDGTIAFDDSGNYEYSSVNTVTGRRCRMSDSRREHRWEQSVGPPTRGTR
jgi:hypothetical protein